MHKKSESAPTLQMPAPAAEPAAPAPVPATNGSAKVKSSAPPSDGPDEAIDPVCDMTVTVKGARYHTEHEGQTYYFCCPACRKLFQNDPQKYLKVDSKA